jgi:hypothetical protein
VVKLKTLGKKTVFVLAVAGAAVVGGASTVLVNAAIPDTTGVIHGCYRSTGALRVIDSENSQTCNNNETGLNWNQSGGSGSSAPTVHDANGQTLGLAMDTTSYSVKVYNAMLHRSFPIGANYDSQLDVGEVISPYFPTTDCSGIPYTQGEAPGAKLTLYTWRNNNAHSYATVPDTAQATTITIQSRLMVDEYHPEGLCQAYPQGGDRSVFPLTTTSLPFSTPIATPLKF